VESQSLLSKFGMAFTLVFALIASVYSNKPPYGCFIGCCKRHSSNLQGAVLLVFEPKKQKTSLSLGFQLQNRFITSAVQVLFGTVQKRRPANSERFALYHFFLFGLPCIICLTSYESTIIKKAQQEQRTPLKKPTMTSQVKDNCDRHDLSDMITTPSTWDDKPPPTRAQLDMAAKIERVLDHKFRVVCLPSTIHDCFPLESKASFGLNKYKRIRSPRGTPKPNRYRLEGLEGTMVGFAAFHTFDITIYPPCSPLHPNGTINVIADYPHHGPLCGLAKLVAFCEVGPHTEQRLVFIREDLDDALDTGLISYISADQDENAIEGNMSGEKETEMQDRTPSLDVISSPPRERRCNRLCRERSNGELDEAWNTENSCVLLKRKYDHC